MRRGLAPVVLVLAACGSDGRTLRDTVVDPPATTTTTTTTTATIDLATDLATAAGTQPPPTAGATTGAATDDTVFIDELFSPENAVAEIVGRGPIDAERVTVDGAPADVIALDLVPPDGFVTRVRILDEGAHTVCVSDACGRVFTLGPDAQSPEEVVATIEEAIMVVQVEYGDVVDRFPAWTIEIGGAAAGTGGAIDRDRRTITVFRNRGREVDDVVRTILHEYGHVADVELLDDEGRAAYRSIRGVDPSLAWRSPGPHRDDDWGAQPAEDFAEVMVMIWTDGRWTPRTEAFAPAPDATQLAAVADLAGT